MKLKERSLRRAGYIAGVATFLSLAACGGGGGSTSAETTVSVAGVASKGLLAHAQVSAYKLNSDGTKGALIKSVETGADGTYTVTGLTPGALVLLEVTAKSDGTTTMKDEATGETVTLPGTSDFKMRAATTLESVATNNAQITPYSEMAVALAVNNGGIKPDVVATANATVSAFVGVPVLTDRPTFDASGKATNAAALKLAAVSELAMAGVSDGSDSCAAGNGANVLSSVTCVVNLLSTKGTTSNVTAALNTAQEAAKSKADISDPVELAKVAAPLVAQPVELTVVPVAQQSAIQEAKTLIQSVRNTAAALSSTASQETLASRLKAMADSSHGVADPVNKATMTLVSAVDDAIRISRHAEAPAFLLPYAPQPYFYSVWGVSEQVVTAMTAASRSGCRFKTSNDFAVDATAPTDHVGCQVLQGVVWGAVTVPGASYPSYLPLYAVKHAFGLSKSGDDSYSMKSSLIKVKLSADIPSAIGAITPLNESSAQPFSATLTRTGSPSNYTGLSVTGDLAPGVDFAYDNTGLHPVVLGTHQTVNLSVASVAVDMSTTRVNLSGAVRVYDTTVLQSRVSLLEGSYIQAKTAVGGDVSAPSVADLSAHRMHLVLEGQLKDGFKVNGTLDLSDFVHTDTRWGATKGSFAGSFTDMSGTAKLFDGLLTMNMPTDSGLNWSMTFNGDVVTTGTNTLNINLSAQASPTVFGDYSASGRYTQGDKTFLLTAIASKTVPSNDTLTFATPSGVGFVYKRGDTTVAIKKGTSDVGTFEVSNSKLTYADHTYEQY